MPRPRSFRWLAPVVAAAALTGCSTPASGAGTVADGRKRVVELVTEAQHALPTALQPSTPIETGTTACRRKFLGYAVGSTGRHHVEAPSLVPLPAGTDPHPLLGAIEQRWRNQGYTVDGSAVNDARYPKVRARTPDGYEVVATAIMLGDRRLDLYAASKCLAGS